MRCKLHRFPNKAEYNSRHLIKYFTSIRQDNNTVCEENYCMKIIMYIIPYFTCTSFWNIFLYCIFNTVV